MGSDDPDSPEDAAHERLVRAILCGTPGTPLVLKGSWALRIAYGRDRVAGDLEFDAPHRVHLLPIIVKQLPPGFAFERLDTPEATPSLTQHRLHYACSDGLQSLAIAVSCGAPPENHDVVAVHGLRVASISWIAHQTLLAAHDGARPRTKVDDLYDLDLIAQRYPAALSSSLIERFCGFASSPGDLVRKYQDAVEHDARLGEQVDLGCLATSICRAAKQLSAAQRHRSGVSA